MKSKTSTENEHLKLDIGPCWSNITIHVNCQANSKGWNHPGSGSHLGRRVRHPGLANLFLSQTISASQVSLGGMQASVKDLYIHGNVRIVLKPLLQKLPLVGGVEVAIVFGNLSFFIIFICCKKNEKKCLTSFKTNVIVVYGISQNITFVMPIFIGHM